MISSSSSHSSSSSSSVIPASGAAVAEGCGAELEETMAVGVPSGWTTTIEEAEAVGFLGIRRPLVATRVVAAVATGRRCAGCASTARIVTRRGVARRGVTRSVT
ncbi:hypothetical protein AG1IA_10414 [Rhizoctonia solani AG-1 IA]|uniref:Uncharacterized protein n=1 Tax=Thanatephorus cucumeris (strain AG1-IA) TaxID=983506 RepID=L8WBK1_THACA|nr:hypothetical protein AG1IA_10414 [Rhizoctonia solani AG-1 IA]